MAMVEVHVPDIGDFDEVAVIELLVKPGDTVKAEQSLITVESDKASMEIPSSTAGVVKELRVKLGDKVKQGSVVLVLEAEGGAAAPVAAPAAASMPAPAAAPAAAPAPAPARSRLPRRRWWPRCWHCRPSIRPIRTPGAALVQTAPSLRKTAWIP